jgi:glycosyltransferase 2 family protein
VISPPPPSSPPLAGRIGPIRALLRNRVVQVTLRYGLGFALLGLIVWHYWDVRDQRGDQVGLAVVLTRSLDWSSLALGFAACTFAVLATFVRWYLLVRAQELPFTMRDAIRLGLVGYFFNTFLPGAVGGDLVKAAYLAREQSRRAVAISTLILDRVIGLAGLFWLASLVGGGLYFSGAFDDHLADADIRWRIQSGLLLASAIAAGSLLAWLSLLVLPTNWLAAIEARLRTIRVVGPTLGELMSAVRMYRQKGRYVAAALGLAMLSHSGLVLAFYCGAHFFTPANELPPLGLHLLLVPIGMTIQAFIPLPGGMGGAEAVFGYLYELLGYQPAAGVLGVMGRRLIEFTLGFAGYLVYLRMGAVPAAAKSTDEEHILKFPTEPAALAKGEASAS